MRAFRQVQEPTPCHPLATAHTKALACFGQDQKNAAPNPGTTTPLFTPTQYHQPSENRGRMGRTPAENAEGAEVGWEGECRYFGAVFSHCLAGPRNVRVHSEAVHVPVHEYANETRSGEVGSARASTSTGKTRFAETVYLKHFPKRWGLSMEPIYTPPWPRRKHFCASARDSPVPMLSIDVHELVII